MTDAWASNRDYEKLIEKTVANVHELALKYGTQVAFILFKDDQLYRYGNEAIVSIIRKYADEVETHSSFHLQMPSERRVRLPPAPDLNKLTFKTARAFLAKWLRLLLGSKPGYGNPNKKPHWWPIEWSANKQPHKGITLD